MCGTQIGRRVSRDCGGGLFRHFRFSRIHALLVASGSLWVCGSPCYSLYVFPQVSSQAFLRQQAHTNNREETSPSVEHVCLFVVSTSCAWHEARNCIFRMLGRTFDDPPSRSIGGGGRGEGFAGCAVSRGQCRVVDLTQIGCHTCVYLCFLFYSMYFSSDLASRRRPFTIVILLCVMLLIWPFRGERYFLPYLPLCSRLE